MFTGTGALKIQTFLTKGLVYLKYRGYMQNDWSQPALLGSEF